MRRSHIGLLALVTLAGVALAGCAQPDESVGGDAGDAGDARYAMIDGRLYECDDSVSTSDVCEEWMAADDASGGASANASEATLNEDGTATIDGRTYECDDTLQVDVGVDEGCDEWHLANE